MVEDLLAAGGVIVSHQTVRSWAETFGRILPIRFDAHCIGALRGGAGVVDPREEMVVAEGLGDECRQASRSAKAVVALARRLAVIMHRMWCNGTEFRWTRDHDMAKAA